MAVATENRVRRGFIGHIHAFRGFAILNIVAVHAWAVQIDFRGGDKQHSTGVSALYAVNEILFHGSTLYFALISGLLFSLVLQSRGWPAFFKSKALNVVTPYIVITVILTLYAWSDETETFRLFRGDSIEFLTKAAENIIFGNALFHLWYIPTLVVLYAATPLLAWVLKSANTRWLIWPVILAPLVVSRTRFDDPSLGTQIYFLGAYAVGMLMGRNYEDGFTAFRRYRNELIEVVLLTTLALFATYLLEYDKVGPVSLRETLFYVQKLAFALLVLLYLREREGNLPDWLHTLGTYAFSIYFLHAIVIMHFTEIELALSPKVLPALTLLAAGFVSFVMSLYVSIVLSALAMRGLGKRSRMLLGV